jgi:hypothetical protein
MVAVGGISQMAILARTSELIVHCKEFSYIYMYCGSGNEESNGTYNIGEDPYIICPNTC